MPRKGDEIKYDSVECAGVTIDYSWCHSRRKTLGIKINHNKSISVRVPLRTRIKDIRAFVISRAEWIFKVWKKLELQTTKHQQDYIRGSIFMYSGEAYRLEFTTGQHSSILLYDDLMILTAPNIPSEDAVRRIITNWYRKQAVEIVKERSVDCHKMMRDQGIPLPPITIRTMKTRWGSYSYHTQRISLNQNLIKAPQECLDYVIIHELCHIKVRHHGSEFWEMVSRYVPDYLKVRLRLRQYS